jgi:hypothetical protein
VDADDSMPGGDTIMTVADVPGTIERLFALSTRWNELYSDDGAQHWVVRNTGLAPGRPGGTAARSGQGDRT